MGSGRNSNSFKHLCMFLLPASMKRIESKTVEKTWRHRFHHYKSMGIFSDAQGQLTPESVVRSGQISNSSKLLCMSSLPASMKRIRSKTAEKTWRRRFPHYNLWELSVAMETRVLIQPGPKLNAGFPPPQ